MIQKIKNQNVLCKAFTLIEMMIVLVIIWIMLMATVYMSGEQIQKVRNKTVKESILAEMQSHYSRNLWSSSYATQMYKTMEVTFSWNTNKIDFSYISSTWLTLHNETFLDKFEIKSISSDDSKIDSVTLYYSPYNISCKIWTGENGEHDSVTIVTRVNDSKNYCFVIPKQNCRLMELSESKCKEITGEENN
jgi:prepilin-type N-terminal cleavage/methylation domain-containing protein